MANSAADQLHGGCVGLCIPIQVNTCYTEWATSPHVLQLFRQFWIFPVELW